MFSTNYDVLRVEVQVSEGKSEVMNAADNSVLARLKLNEILGKEEDPRLLTGSLPILDLSVVKTLALPDLRERADVMALADRVEAFDHLESAAGSYLIPRLSAFFNYQYYNNITDDPYDKNSFRHAHSAGLTLTWNIFRRTNFPSKI